LEGLAPPLRDSEWALGSDQRLARIVLHGVRDEISVKGSKYALNMPALAEALTDAQIADVLTYVRREWGHAAPPVPLATVAAVRVATAKRDDAWTEPELLSVP
jgi:mono/diheme cytochrome c family protein